MSDTYRKFAVFLYELNEAEPMKFPFGPTAKKAQQESEKAGYDTTKYASKASAEADELGLEPVGIGGRYAAPDDPHTVVAKTVTTGDDAELVKVKPKDDQASGDQNAAETPADTPKVEVPSEAQWQQFVAKPEEFAKWMNDYLENFNPQDPALVARLQKKPPLYPTKGNSKIGLYGDGGDRPLGNHIIVNGKAVKLPARLQNAANAISKEFTDKTRETSLGAQTKTSAPVEKRTAPAPSPKEIGKAIAQHQLDVQQSVSNFKARTEADSFKKLPKNIRAAAQEATVDIEYYLKNPTPESARYLIGKHKIQTNSVDKAVFLGDMDKLIPDPDYSVLDSIQDPKQRSELRKKIASKATKARAAAREILFTKSPIHGNTKGAVRSTSASEFLMRSLRSTLGDEDFDKAVRVRGGMATMLRPDIMYEGHTRTIDILVDHKSATIAGGAKYDKIFTEVDPDELQTALTENVLHNENYTRRNTELLAGAPQPEIDAATKKDVARAMHIVEHRNYGIDLLDKLSKSQVANFDNFEGATVTHKIADAFTKCVTRAATRTGEDLGPKEHKVIKMVNDLADMYDPNSEQTNTPTEAFDRQWLNIKTTANQSDNKFKNMMPELVEVLASMRLAMEGCDVYVPTDRNFSMIDCIGVKQLEGLKTLNDIDTLIDGISFVHTSTDLRSVKRNGGAAPAISSIQEFVKFDESKFGKVELKKTAEEEDDQQIPQDAVPEDTPENSDTPDEGAEESTATEDASPTEEPAVDIQVPTDNSLDLNFILHGARDIMKNDVYGHKLPEVADYLYKAVTDPRIAQDIRRYYRLPIRDSEKTTPEQARNDAQELIALISMGNRPENVAEQMRPPKTSKVFKHKAIKDDRDGNGRQRVQLTSAFGNLTEYILNNHVKQQGFMNEAYFDNEVVRTDGIDVVTKFQFAGVGINPKNNILPLKFRLVASNPEDTKDAGANTKVLKKTAVARNRGNIKKRR